MSPSMNQSSRAGFMNDTRISMQSSLIKTGDDGASRIMNQSNFGSNLTRNQFNMFSNQQNASKAARERSMNSSLDFKHGDLSTLNQIGSQNIDSAEQQKKKQLAEQLHAKGYDARKKGDYDMAISQYTEALKIMPNHFKALFNRGFAFDKIGAYDKAINDYSEAIKIDPNNAYTYYNKGISLDRKGEYDEAIMCFSKAIQLVPNKADFYHNRGFAYRKKKEFDNAINDYQNAIKIDPNHFKAYYNRAFCWDKLGRYSESEADY